MYDAFGGMIDLDNPINDECPLNQGLVAWWMALPGLAGGRFLYDLRGLNPGTLTNMTTVGTSGWGPTTRPGGFGEVRFDGSNDYILASDSSLPSGLASRSFSALFKTSATLAFANYRQVLFYGSAGSGNSVFFGIGNDTNYGSTGFGVSQYGDAFGVTGFNDGEWHHGVATFSGGVWSLYIDGVLQATKAMATNTVLGGTLCIGSDRPLFSDYWLGSLDDIRIHNRALSAAEIAAMYDDGRTGYRRALNWDYRRVWSLGVTAPVADFIGTPVSGTAPLSVAFTDASTNTPTAWLWEKNDGSGWVAFTSGSTTQNPTEAFAAGTWSVRLTATNAGGSDSETKTDYLTVATPVTPTNPTALWRRPVRTAVWASRDRTMLWSQRDRSAVWANGV